MQVTTRTGDKETVIVAQPDTCHLFPVTIFLPPRLTCQAQRLVFECGRADFLMAIVVHVKQEQVFDGCFFLTGHLVFIGFQRRTGRSHRVDNPEIFHGTLVRGRYGKITGIGGPDDPPDSFPLAVAKRVGIQQAIGLTETEVFHAEGSELYVRNRTILVVFFQLLIILAGHPVEVQVFCIHDRFSVGRERGPIRIFRLFLLILKPGQFTRGIVVGEKEYLFLRTLILVGTVFFSILRRGDLESKSASVLSCFELLDG